MSDYTGIKRNLLRTSGALFEDQDFPAANSSLFFRSWSSTRIEWKRPHEIVDNPKFVVEGSRYVDLEQGRLGNCWFVAAAASLAANNWQLLHRVVPQDQSFDQDYAGIFRFRFWQYGVWKEVVVDDRLPTRQGRLMYCSNTRQRNEFWVALLEKAYAKLNGCYESIVGGRVHDALLDLTGGITELVDLQDSSLDTLTSVLTSTYHMNTLMGGAIFGKGSRESRRPSGLYEMHAYSIIRMKTVTYRGQKVLLLLVRNPFGHGEWNGAWSDKSREWSELDSTERTDEALNRRDNGEFWMSVQDFRANFDELELCHLSVDAMTAEREHALGETKTWKRTEFTGRWLRGVSAGGPLRSYFSRAFWTNPQYRFKMDDTSRNNFSVVISLMEISDKLHTATEDVSIGFVVFKLKAGKEPSGKLNSDNFFEHSPQLVDTSGVFWPYRERSVHFVLETGSYVIIPCTFVSNMEAEFYLRIFSEITAEPEPTEEPIGPTGEIEPEPLEMIEMLFYKYQGPDHRVNAFRLHKILEEARQEEYGKMNGYSLETCRCLLSLLDTEISGNLKLDAVKTLWKYVKSWTQAFHTADVSNDNTVDTLELTSLYKKIGFLVDSDNLQRIVCRYGDEKGKIHEDDFIQSFSRLLALYRTFKKRSSDGKITQNLSQWLSSTLYV
ncbi:calpain-9-like [Babylonia areolata]|uniref:calpain-9-like n=1 Tax=Babylonia areolata TaxID=304850 RepID=UPI003FD52367